MSALDNLFTPFQLRDVACRNRFVMSPMTRGFSPNGVPGQDVADYYRRRAEAGVGLIITEGVGIDHPAAIGTGSMDEGAVPLMHGAGALAGWRRVVDAVHAAGGVVFPQLWHMGPVRTPGTGLFPDAPSCRPSGLWGPADGLASVPPEYLERMLPQTEPMTENDIADVIAGFGRSARYAKDVGFDGIAIHGAHGYLIDSFFWHETNKRTDRYGGAALAERGRFGAEVVAAIRREIGPDMPVMFRISQWKLQDYDARLADTPAELEKLLRVLVDAGVDVFDVSTRIFSKPAFDGSDLTLAGWIKRLSGKPTMAVGGVGLSKDLQSSFGGGTVTVNNLDQVAFRVEQDEFDLIAVGRSLLVDPQWVEKARNGEQFKPFTLEAFGQLY